MTLEEIGEKFDLTRERVRQIKEKALRKLRNELWEDYENDHEMVNTFLLHDFLRNSFHNHHDKKYEEILNKL